MSGVFDGDFWTVVAPQASRVYPAIWHAILAMSSMHRWKLSEGSLVRYGYYEMALRQCNKAITCLTQIATDSPTASDQEALLMGSILLSSFCNLQGDLREIIMHAYKGLFLFKQMGLKKNSYWSTDPSPTDVVASAADIAPLFTRLESLVTNAPRESPCSSWDLPHDTVSTSNEPFQSITEAYVELFPLLHNFFRVANTEGYWWSLEKMQSSEDYRQPYRRAFTSWKIKFHAFHRSANSPRESVAESGIEGTRLSILRVWELCFESCLDMDSAQEELGWDRCKLCFTRLVQLAERLLGKASADGSVSDRTHLGSLVTMIGEPLYSLAAVCRDVVLRRKAIELLRKYPHREGHFDSHVLVRLAETRVKIEEEAVLSSRGSDGCTCVRGNFVCNMHRIIFPAVKYYEDGFIVTNITTVDDVKKKSIGHKLKIPWDKASSPRPRPAGAARSAASL